MEKISGQARVVWNKRILLSLLLTMFLFTVSASMSIGATYDDFNASTINSSLWNIDNPGVLSQSGGLLHAQTPSNLLYGHLGSTYNLRGDFEVILDYRDFQSTATTCTGNVAQIWLQVSDGTNFIAIWRGYCPGWPSWDSTIRSFGAADAGVPAYDAMASTNSGQLKISRVGSTITTYYNEGVSWSVLGTYTGAGTFTGDARMQIAVYTGDNGTFHVDSDGITYTGELVSGQASSYDCEESTVAGLEMTLSCPTNVTVGSPLNVTVKLENWCCYYGTSVTVSRFMPMLMGNAAGNVSGLGIYGPYQVYNTQTIPNATGVGCPNGEGDTPGTKTFNLSVMGAAPTALANTMAEVNVNLTNGQGDDITGGSCMVLVKP